MIRPTLRWSIAVGRSTYYGTLRGALAYWWRSRR